MLRYIQLLLYTYLEFTLDFRSVQIEDLRDEKSSFFACTAMAYRSSVQDSIKSWIPDDEKLIIYVD